MKIYLDIVIIINFFFDFLLLFSVSYILKRNTKIHRLIIGSLIGGVSLLSLFINMTSFELFLYKVIISILMIFISFGYKDIKYFINNIIYLYINSIILGGFLYFINNMFSYKTIGLIFINNGYSLNLLLVFLLTPLIIFLYIKNTKKLKENYSKYYKTKIVFLNGKSVNITGFLDTGNNLYDPYKKRPIIIINNGILNDYKPKYILVPVKTINKTSMMKCFKIKDIYINNIKVKINCLVGISDNNFNIDGVDLLLHSKLIGG